MVNLCFAMFGVPVFTFAIVNSGDWIDKMAAKATGESTTFINQEKTKVNLSTQPTTLVERAIQTQYKIMIEKTVNGIKKGLSEAGKKARSDKPVDIVIAGGTSIPVGFDVLFREVIKQAEFSIPIGNIVRPADPLFSVARGCLIAAENSLQ
jgi:1-aminocyclopropane-1-carboxylate deaminase/D-cysteine desulfhydrase-like pyridoxal-dependent ACC family enzyme